MIRGGGVRNEIVEEIDDEMVEEVDTSVCGLIISIKKAVINEIATSISDEEPLFLYVKKLIKNSSDGSLFILNFLERIDRDELERINLTFLNEQAKVSEIDFVQEIGKY